MNSSDMINLKKASEIARKVKEYAKSIIKKDALLVEIAEKIEAKIEELGGKPAFPVNLCMNDIAAHSTPALDGKETAKNLLKVDIGVSVEGSIVDFAFSLDLSEEGKYKKLVEASEEALKEALKVIKKDVELWVIGKAIQEKIMSFGFSPIRNLSGHSLGQYTIHAGLTIPNYNNNNSSKLLEGIYAIEPFATLGEGVVQDGKPSRIFRLNERKGVRGMKARKILEFIEKEYKTLPFCERWIEKLFPSCKFVLSLLVKEKILHEYPQLIEKSRKEVSQAETSVIINEKVEVLC